MGSVTGARSSSSRKRSIDVVQSDEVLLDRWCGSAADVPGRSPPAPHVTTRRRRDRSLASGPRRRPRPLVVRHARPPPLDPGGLGYQVPAIRRCSVQRTHGPQVASAEDASGSSLSPSISTKRRYLTRLPALSTKWKRTSLVPSRREGTRDVHEPQVQAAFPYSLRHGSRLSGPLQSCCGRRGLEPPTFDVMSEDRNHHVLPGGS